MFRPSPRRLLPLAALVTCSIVAGVAAAQHPSSTTATTNATAPVAYIYVAGQSGGTGFIYQFFASSNGQLIPIIGSPLASSVTALALNGKWLFGSAEGANNQNGIINSYSIAANGLIKMVDTTTVNANGYQPTGLFLDHTGASLYAELYSSDITGYETYSIDQSNGKITPVGSSGFSAGGSSLTFTGNNQFAYGASCFRFTPIISGFDRRTSDGALMQLGMNAALPAAPAGDQYCPIATAADPYNDVVISMDQLPSNGGNPTKYQLAVYTADRYGNLSTTSTYQNMATLQVEPDTLAMSPKGYYLAAAGSSGFQVSYMHGSKPLTPMSGVVLPGVQISKMFWDNSAHLYVLGYSTNKLYVFDVGTAGVKQAPGSPYAIPTPTGLIVLPK